MRIGLVNEFFAPFAPGGAEWSVWALAQSLRAKGHQVVVVTPNYGAASFEERDGIRIYRFPFPKKLKPGHKLPGFLWHANLLFYAWTAYQLERIGRKEGLDLLHAQNKYSVVGAYWAARRLRIPVVATIRDTSFICRIAVCLQHHEAVPANCSLGKLLGECSEEYYEHYVEKKSMLRHWKDKISQTYHWFDVHFRRAYLNKVDRIIGVSKGILSVHENSRVFSAQSGIREPLYNLPDELPGIPESTAAQIRKQFGLGNSRIVLYVGKFSGGKGTEDFVKAGEVVSRKIKDVLFVLAGSGKQPAAASHIRVLGQLPHDETLQLMAAAEIVVVPSVWPEPLSRVLLEALALGKPVVGTRVGGTPEAIRDGENGILAPRSDPAALAEAIQKILSDPQLGERMGKASRELARSRFHSSTLTQRYELLYQQCIHEAKAEKV